MGFPCRNRVVNRQTRPHPLRVGALSVAAGTVPLMDEVMRERLAFSMRVQELRTVYHWAIGEVIQLRLAYIDAPQIEVGEDLPANNVTLRLGEDTLTLRPGQSHEENRATVREWIRERVDVTRLTRGTHQGPGVAYWRSVGRGLI